MKPILIKILIGAAGFAGGFASGFLVHRKINNVQIEEISEEEMSEIVKKDSAAEAPENAPARKEETAVSEELGAAQQLPEKEDDIRNTLQGKTPYIQADKDTKTAYEKLWKATSGYSSEENANQYPVWKTEGNAEVTDDAEDEHPSEEDFDEDFLEQLEQEAVEAGNAFVDPPHQIDLISFYNDHPEWDSVTVKWYMEDNTWVDEGGEVIPDIQSYTGVNVRNPFDEDPIDDDPDVRFWANPRYQTNYEFIRHHRSWAEANGEVK